MLMRRLRCSEPLAENLRAWTAAELMSMTVRRAATWLAKVECLGERGVED